MYWSADSTKETAVGVGSLFQWAKDDNPVEYERFKMEKRSGVPIEKEEIENEYYNDGFRNIKALAAQGKLTVRRVKLWMLSSIKKIGENKFFYRNYHDLDKISVWDVCGQSFPFASPVENFKFSVPNPLYDPKKKTSSPVIEHSCKKIFLQLVGEPIFDACDFNSIDFLPYFGSVSPYPKRIFNLFPGFKFQQREEPIDFSPCKNVIRHVYEVMANGVKSHAEYILDIIQDMILNPGQKLAISLVFRSKERAGKNTFWDFIREKILPNMSGQLSSVDQLTQKHNTHLLGKLLIVMNEAQNYGGAFASNDRLKSLISDQKITIEPKGKDSFDVNNFTRFIFLTNNAWPVKADRNNGRYALFDVSNDKIGDREYFNALYDEMKNPECAEAFFQFLVHRKQYHKDLRTLPETDFAKETRWNSVPSAIKFMVDVVSKNIAEVAWFKNEKDDIEMLTLHNDALFAYYRQWCQDSDIRFKMEKKPFLMQLNSGNGKAGVDEGLKIKPSRFRMAGPAKLGIHISRNDLKKAIREYLKDDTFKFEDELDIEEIDM